MRQRRQYQRTHAKAASTSSSLQCRQQEPLDGFCDEYGPWRGSPSSGSSRRARPWQRDGCWSSQRGACNATDRPARPAVSCERPLGIDPRRSRSRIRQCRTAGRGGRATQANTKLRLPHRERWIPRAIRVERPEQGRVEQPQPCSSPVQQLAVVSGCDHAGLLHWRKSEPNR